MIPLSEINNAAEKFGVPAETIEKDYVISWVLFCLSQSKIKEDFIFYGGTAIKRIYFEDHRFSEDIDLLSTQICFGKLRPLFISHHIKYLIFILNDRY